MAFLAFSYSVLYLVSFASAASTDVSIDRRSDGFSLPIITHQKTQVQRRGTLQTSAAIVNSR